MLYLVIRDNVGRHAQTNTWHQKVEGVFLLTNTVNTVRRVALMSDSNDPVPASMLQIEQSLILHSSGATITPGPPLLKDDRPLYKGLEGGSTVHELRDDGTRCGPVDSGDVQAGRRCVGETTFKFKFNFTCASHIVGGDTHTLVRLRYSIVGHPEIFVDTLPFRVVAKEDKGRDAADVSALLKSLKDSKRLMEKALSASDGTSDDPRQAVLNECQQKLLDVVEGVSQLARSTAGPSSSTPELESQASAAPATPESSVDEASVAAAASSAAPASAAGPAAATESVGLAELSGLVRDALGEGSSSADGVVTNLAGELVQRIEGGAAERSVTGSPSRTPSEAGGGNGGNGDDEGKLVEDFLNPSCFEEGQQQARSLSGPIEQQPPKRQRVAAASSDAAGASGAADLSNAATSSSGTATGAAADAAGADAAGAAGDEDDDDEMAFRSASSSDLALPIKIKRSLSESTEASVPAAGVAEATTPPKVQRLQTLQTLLCGAWRQAHGQHQLDDPRAAAKSKLFVIVRDTLLARRAQRGGPASAVDLAETLDELNDLKEFLDFNGVTA